MATFDFRILLETVAGKKTSYISQSFVDTSDDLVLSSSQVHNRITSHGDSYNIGQLRITGSSNQVQGTILSNFVTKLTVGDALKIKSASVSQFFTVASIRNNKSMSLNANWTGVTTSQASGRRQLPEYVFKLSDGMISCSYQNTTKFTGNILPSTSASRKFSDNTLLSASLSGSLDTGSIQLLALNTQYDRLLRYKFIGEKVCNVLSLPDDQWVYIDQFRLPADDESNFFEGNVKSKNAFFSDTITFANTSNINSDIPFFIDTGSDRYIKFIDTRGIPEVALRIGYDKDTDSYEISGSTAANLKFGGVKSLQVSEITSSGNSLFGDGSTDVHKFVGAISASGNISSSGFLILDADLEKGIHWNAHSSLTSDKDVFQKVIIGKMLIGSGSAAGAGRTTITIDTLNQRVGIGTISPTKTLEVIGDISASGDFFANSGSFNYITASKIDVDASTISIGGESFNKTLLTNLKRGHSSTGISPAGRIQKTADMFVEGVMSSSAGISSSNIALTGTLSAEQITSTDDMLVTDDLTVGGDTNVTGTISSSGFIGGGSFATGSYDFPGAIMGYNVQGLNVGHASYSLTTSFAVPDAGFHVSFVAPKSGIVEIEIQILYDGGSVGQTLIMGLSDNASYNAVADYYEQTVADADEADDYEIHHKWVVPSLTPGTTYVYWLGARVLNTLGTPKFNYGGSGTGRFPDFIMKATALPSNATIET